MRRCLWMMAAMACFVACAKGPQNMLEGLLGTADAAVADSVATQKGDTIAPDDVALRASHEAEDGAAAERADSLQGATLSLAFVGDVLMGTNFPSESYVTADRGRSLFVDCKDILRAADLAIANLEGTCYDGTAGETRKQANSETCYIFRMPGDHAQNLVDAGIDIVNFANNHSFDFGMTGRKLTLAKMEEVGIKVSGIKGLAEGAVMETCGVKVGYVSFAASCTQVNDLNNLAEVKRLVLKYRAMCDVLVVGFHGGAEGEKYTHVPKGPETFLGENRGDVMKFAHLCVDNGADIVVGHGPHVPRAMELYKGHLVAYSLGNFCAPYRMSTSGKKGHAPLLVAEVNVGDGSFVNGRIHSYLQVPGKGPRLDKAQSALHDIRQLTAEDFPDTPLRFGENGEVGIR